MVNYDESNPDSGSFVLNWQPEEESTKKIKTGDVYTMKLVSRTGATLAGNFDWQVTAMRNGSRHRTAGDCASEKIGYKQDFVSEGTVGVLQSGVSIVRFVAENTQGSNTLLPYDPGCGRTPNGSDTGGYGKKIANEPIVIRVVVKKPNSSWQIQKIFKQKIKDIITQEYWDHYPYVVNNELAATDFPLVTEITTPKLYPGIYDDSAGAASNCILVANNSLPSPCSQTLSANYYDNGIKPLAVGDVAGIAVEIRSLYNAETSRPGETPIITSGWRNPEFSESLGESMDNGHQYGRGIDLDLPESPAIEDVYDGTNASVVSLHWCQLTQAGFQYAAARRDAGEWSNVAVQVENSSLSGLYFGFGQFMHVADGSLTTFNYVDCAGSETDKGDIVSALEDCVADMEYAHFIPPGGESRASYCSPDHIHISE